MTEYFSSLDEKGRLPIPTIVREKYNLCSEDILTGFPERGCLCLYSKASLELKAKNLVGNDEPLLNEMSRRRKRGLYSRSSECKLDTMGIIFIPPRLASYAGIKKEVVILDAGDCIKIYGKETWEKKKE